MQSSGGGGGKKSWSLIFFSCLSSSAIILLTKRRAGCLTFPVSLVVQSTCWVRESLSLDIFLLFAVNHASEIEKSWSLDFSCLSSYAIIPLKKRESVA